VEFAVNPVQTILSEGNEARVILDPGDISVLEGEIIVSAYLELSVPPVTADRDVQFRVCTIETAWREETPTWDRPWTTPGGDLDVRYAQTMTFGRQNDSGRLVIDVTQAMQEMADGTVGRNGFMVTAAAGKVGLTEDELTRCGPFVGGVLRVNYREISHFGLSRIPPDGSE
jgi:hypothetical protein